MEVLEEAKDRIFLFVCANATSGKKMKTIAALEGS